MHMIERARAAFAAAPREAVGDAAGLAAMALIILAGFMLPALV